MTLSVSVFLLATFGILDFGTSLREQYTLSEGISLISRELSLPAEIEVCGNLVKDKSSSSSFCQKEDMASDASVTNQPVFCEYGKVEPGRNTNEACQNPDISIADYLDSTKLNITDWLSTNRLNPDDFAVTLKLTRVVYESNNSDTFLYMAIKRITPYKIRIINFPLKNCTELMIKINIINPNATDGDSESYFINAENLVSACV